MLAEAQTEAPPAMIPNVLTVAGSDPSGGAGIQADLKTFSALGTFGTSVVTALTAQNTLGVTAVHPVPPAFIAAQIDTLFEDLAIAAVKVGMVGSVEVARTVADGLRRHGVEQLVVDPVMVAKGGDPLIDPAAVAAVRDLLVPLALIITPNVHEAGALLGAAAPSTLDELADAASDLHRLGARHVLIKGGALGGSESTDLLFDGSRAQRFSVRRVDTQNTHGTGCTLTSAIAALLPASASVAEAVEEAKHYVSAAISASGRLNVGSGHGPVHHFHALWPPT
jgi:hydroxymethylpyrimidine/phosphomethylpyrimidine kinase